MSKKKYIDLFYQAWSIEMVEDIPTEDNRFVLGNCDSIRHNIKIRTKDVDGNPIPKQEINRTLIHELLHAISAVGAFWNDINETQTEFIAVCLHKTLSQLKVITDL